VSEGVYEYEGPSYLVSFFFSLLFTVARSWPLQSFLRLLTKARHRVINASCLLSHELLTLADYLYLSLRYFCWWYSSNWVWNIWKNISLFKCQKSAH